MGDAGEEREAAGRLLHLTELKADVVQDEDWEQGLYPGSQGQTLPVVLEERTWDGQTAIQEELKPERLY